MINFRKANWEAFTAHSKEDFPRQPPPTDVFAGELGFQHIMTKAAAKNIPAGYIREIRPYYPREAVALVEEQDTLQATQPGDSRIATLTKEIDKEVTSYRQSKWEEFRDGVDLKKGASRLWSTVKNLSGQQKPPASQLVTFCDAPAWDKKDVPNSSTNSLHHVQPPPQRPTVSSPGSATS